MNGNDSAALEARREAAIQLLGEYFARDALEVDDLERRIDVASRARSVAELRDALEGLPRMTGELPAPAARDLVGPRRADLPPDRVRDRGAVVAVLSGAGRSGSWAPPRHLFAFACMGGVELDFREARLGPGVTEVTCVGLMGGIEIVVPPDLPVVANGVGVMGGFEHRSRGDRAGLTPRTPLLKINGVACMGAVKVAVRYPGETKREAKKRIGKDRGRKAERARLKPDEN